MEPTIDQNDGYVVVPTGTIEQGEIIEFRSAERDERVTHRVVGRSSEGLLTQGDNNDVTDQSTGHPHVQREDVVGSVLTLNGQPITIPGLGVIVSAVATHRLVVLVAAGALLAVSFVSDDSPHARPDRSVVTVREVMLPLFAVVLVTGVVFVLVGAVHHEMTYVAVDGAAGGPNTLSVGEKKTQSVLVSVPSMPFTARLMEAKGMAITSRTANASAISAEVTVPAPTETGAHTTSLTIYRYPAVLPDRLLRTLHSIHPALAAGTSIGTLLVPLYVLYWLLLDGRQPLRAPRMRPRTGFGGWNR